MPGTDEIQVEILDDGTIKLETDKISPANHASADKLFKILAELTGGKTTRTRHGHHHTQQHEHEHAKEKN